VSEFEAILGESEEVRAIRDFGRRAAGVDATVLITGESGTGKGLLARSIHRASARAGRAFVAINCASVPESLFEAEFFGHTRGAFTGAQTARRGLLEQADRGSLFMDEIGELVPPLQAKLLTSIEEGEVRRLGAERPVHVDVRVIAATGIDLEAAVEGGSFRRDLFHRLTVLRIHLPPLRDRGTDVDVFAGHFLESATQRYRRAIRSFDERALEHIRAYAWPGNIRELANAVEAAVLACDGTRIRPADLPDFLRSTGQGVRTRAWQDGRGSHRGASQDTDTGGASPAAGPFPDRTRYSHYGSEAEERKRIVEALRRWRGNKTRAARDLGMARNTLRGKLSRLNVRVEEGPGTDPGTGG
jgi:DNA-binding NtrC family response regulator